MMIATYHEAKRELHIFLEGEIDHHTCLEMSQLADDSIRKYLPTLVIFDFEKVSFMDSSGIGMLLGRYKKIIRFGGRAVMKNVSVDMQRIFAMSGIFKIMPLVEEEKVNG